MNPQTTNTRTLAIGLMGASLGLGNRGVSALAVSLVKLFVETAPKVSMFMLLGTHARHPFAVTVAGNPILIPVVNHRVSPKSKIRENLFYISTLALAYRLVPHPRFRAAVVDHCPWIRATAGADLIGDIRGGDSFSDIYGLWNFLIASLPVLAVIWVRKDVVLFPQTYGPFKHRLSRTVARYILRHASIILSRDREGLGAVAQLIGNSDKIRFCPDVAFSLEATCPTEPEIEPPMPFDRPARLIGVNINGLMFNGGYTRDNMFELKLNYAEFLNQLTTRLLADEGTHILLVPHTFAAPDDVESDPSASRVIMGKVPMSQRHRVHLVVPSYDQHQLKGIIGQCDFFIGSRMHSCIAALSQGIPTVGVAYSKKFKGVFDSVGAGDWIVDGRDMDAQTAVSFVAGLIEHRIEMRNRLGKGPERARDHLRRTFNQLVSLIPVTTDISETSFNKTQCE